MSSARYQGYPYVNPTVTDAPTLDPVTAAKWTNLPRKPISTSIPGPSSSDAGSSSDIPSASGSSSVPIPPKVDIDENPVVYIEFPQESCSDVCQSIESEDVEPEYVQDTILFDPFENRRIVPKEEACSESSASDTHSLGSSSLHNRPIRPNTLDLIGPGPSSAQSPVTNSRFPAIMEKEALVYGTQTDDGFPLSPIPLSEFPAPPPAYTEIAITPSTQTSSPQGPSPITQAPTPQTPPQPQMVQTAPPRTEVILPTPTVGSPIGMMNYNRKYLTCHHCGARVHTLVIRESGHVTYFISFLLFLFVMPCFIIVYFTDCLKHKNHYCPNCNKIIGYELPVFGKKLHYVP